MSSRDRAPCRGSTPCRPGRRSFLNRSLIRARSPMTTIFPKIGRSTVKAPEYRRPTAATARRRAVRKARPRTNLGIRGHGGSRTASVVASAMPITFSRYSRVPPTVRPCTVHYKGRGASRARDASTASSGDIAHAPAVLDGDRRQFAQATESMIARCRDTGPTPARRNSPVSQSDWTIAMKFSMVSRCRRRAAAPSDGPSRIQLSIRLGLHPADAIHASMAWPRRPPRRGAVDGG